MQLRQQQLELDMEQQTVSKLGKEYIKAVFQNFSLPLVYHLAWLDRRRDHGTLGFEEIKYSWIVLFLSPLLTLVSLKNSSSQFYRDEMYV